MNLRVNLVLGATSIASQKGAKATFSKLNTWLLDRRWRMNHLQALYFTTF